LLKYIKFLRHVTLIVMTVYSIPVCSNTLIISCLSCQFLVAFTGWCTQTSALIPYDLKRSRPVMIMVLFISEHTNLRITFCSPNKLYNQLRTPKEKVSNYLNSGLYSPYCNTCNKIYVGQNDRNVTTKFSKHKRYISQITLDNK